MKVAIEKFMQSFIRNKGIKTSEATNNVEGVATDIAEASVKMADALLNQLEIK